MSIKTVKRIINSLPKVFTDSLFVSFAILGSIDIVLSLMGFSLEKIGRLPARIGMLFFAYIILVILTIVIKQSRIKTGVTLDIRGMRVVVREGDILSADGWKLIPFNENFDTQVDDVVIAHSSLNGKFIDSLDDEGKTALKQAIADDNRSPLYRGPSADGNKIKYELGTIKVFKDIMMLALTHFNEQNEPHTNRAEYEQTLRKMWREIRRVHQGIAINIPLVGGGLTQLDDMTEKPNEQLLHCMLCTLKTSNVTFDENVQINIVLTRKALETINLYELKGDL